MARPTYSVEPRPRQRDPFDNPDEWVLTKGNTVLQTFEYKQNASQRAKEVARNQNETLAIYDAAKKQSQEFDYRTDEQKKKDTNRALRDNPGIGGGFGL